jgi:tripartite ATP-independent transporter DctM subunit
MVDAVFLLSFVLLLLARMPIALALGGSSLLYLLLTGTPLTIVPHAMTAAFDSFVLLAIPLFMLAGSLMNSGGTTERLFGFANTLVGHIRGGMGHVNVVASMIFAGMSGSAVADAAGLGQLQIRSMTRRGFDPDFSAAITGASATIGPILPPSIPFVIYGTTASVSVGALFIGGALPGLVIGLLLMVGVYFIARRRNYPVEKRPTVRELAWAFLRALPALATPLFIIGGIVSGLFTPTEAAAAAAVYALVLGLVAYRELRFAQVPQILLQTASLSSSILIIMSAASVFSYVLTYSGMASAAAQFLTGVTTNKYLMLLLINVILLVVGCFMEPISILLVLVPMFLPVVDALQIDRVHFGVVAVLNLMIGLVTPPVGVVLYIVARLAHISFERAVKAMLPFFAVLVVALMIVTYVPTLVTFLPKLFLR